MVMVLTGESLISRRMSVFREEKFLELVRILRESDVSFTNAEMLFHNYEPAPGVEHSGTWMRAEPALIGELKWLGIDAVSCAMNHGYDFGEQGVMINIDNLDRYDMPHAGTGPTLTLARAPAYVDTPNGRVALLAACDHMQVPGGRAVDSRPDMRGKPGVNEFTVHPVSTVDAQAFQELKRISVELGWEARKQARLQSRWPLHVEIDTETLLYFGGDNRHPAMRFQLGTGFQSNIVIDEADLEDTAKWIADARRMADWVIFSFHCGYPGPTADAPPGHLVTLAKRIIDAGADVFVGHGPHRDRGIEVYRGKPIFYSLGDFILQNDTVLRQPSVAYSRYRLDQCATPADFYEARSGNQTRGQDVNKLLWQTVVARVEWKARKLTRIVLYPIDLGMRLPRGQRGRPVLAEGDMAQEILGRVKQMSAPLGTRIDIEENQGQILAAEPQLETRPQIHSPWRGDPRDAR